MGVKVGHKSTGSHSVSAKYGELMWTVLGEREKVRSADLSLKVYGGATNYSPTPTTGAVCKEQEGSTTASLASILPISLLSDDEEEGGDVVINLVEIITITLLLAK